MFARRAATGCTSLCNAPFGHHAVSARPVTLDVYHHNHHHWLRNFASSSKVSLDFTPADGSVLDDDGAAVSPSHTPSPRDSQAEKEQTKTEKKSAWERNAKSTSFVDQLTLSIRAGRGGDGCVAFAREAYVPFGAASGGGGGRGGSVYIRTSAHMRSLARVGVTVVAGDGGHGKGDEQGGKNGKDVHLEVPVGTIMTVRKCTLPEIVEMGIDTRIERRIEYEEELLSRLSSRGSLRMRPEMKRGMPPRQQRRPKRVAEEQEDIYGEDEGGHRTEQDNHDRMEATTSSEDAEKEVFLRSAYSDDPEYLAQEQESVENDDQEQYQRSSRRRRKAEVETGAKVEEEGEDLEEDPDNLMYEEPVQEYISPEERALQAEEQQERRAILDSAWRHYPGALGTAGPASGESLADSLFQREEFHLAEERYAVALKKELDSRQTNSLSGRVGREEVVTVDLDAPTADNDNGFLVASGGTGGFGNPFFLQSGYRSPKFATRGRLGDVISIDLEFKSPADVGFIGLPNAGKSSLLRALTGATRTSAKVGGWQFTTLSPNVGTMRLSEKGQLIGTGKEPIFDSSVADEDVIGELPEHASSGRASGTNPSATSSETRLVLADLPGLIEGAYMNRGLGHTFLRHAERCDTLIYVLDVSPGCAEPWKDLWVLRNELEGYKPGLSRKIGCVIANKCDALGPSSASTSSAPPSASSSSTEGSGRLSREEAMAKLNKLREEVAKHPSDVVSKLQVVPVSAMWRMGVEIAAARLRDLVGVAAKNRSV